MKTRVALFLTAISSLLAGCPFNSETILLTFPDEVTRETAARFTFEAADGSASFVCKLDSAAKAPCSSPMEYQVGDGAHTFTVAAVIKGKEDPSPAVYDWTVDRTAPATTITGGPANPTSATDATFTFSSTKQGTFKCSLDTAPAETCASGKSYSSLQPGDHTFKVFAVDYVGNEDATPATFAWTINGPPDPELDTITLTVDVPSNTPEGEIISVKSGPFASFLMTEIAPFRWSLTMTRGALRAARAALDGNDLTYAYDHSSSYMGGEFFSDDPVMEDWWIHRRAPIGSGASPVDTVARWRFFPFAGTVPPTMSATLTTFLARVSGWAFQAGIEIADYWTGTNEDKVIEGTSAAIKRAKANWVQIAPPWDYLQVDPLPIIGYKADAGQYTDAELRAHVANLKANGFKVLFRIQVCCTPVGNTASKSAGWWNEWFRQYRAWMLHHAEIAADTGVDAILLDWSGNIALPTADGVPSDTVARWASMMTDMRLAYSGKLGFDLLAGGDTPAQTGLPWPWNGVAQIADNFDFFGLALWRAYSSSSSPTQGELDTTAENTLSAAADAVYNAKGKPIVLSSIAVRSVDGGSAGLFNDGDEVGNAPFKRESQFASYHYDGIEQAMVYQALLKAAASRPHIVGFYPFHYHWTTVPLAPDFSIRGKPAEKLVSQWYERALQ